jgi:hypothetical protein
MTLSHFERTRLLRRTPTALLALALAFCLSGCVADSTPHRRYTFSWPLQSDDARRPRGGTTRGPAPTLEQDVHPGWVALQEEGLSRFERDRRAILAMAGRYRVTFDFLELYSLDPAYTELDVPYQSWATEAVYVVEDEGDFISLQHIMVLFFEVDGKPVGPAVTKHWRQDWRYEDTDLHVFRGRGRFERMRIDAEEARGAWSQAVFQVDDAPRYEALGRWQHDGNRSVWESDTTWRPLPRREFSVRKDYQALVGVNRHVITPRGWIHEQRNAKRIVPSDGRDDSARYLSQEIGLNRYLRIEGHDFSAGDAYWEETADYWREVRDAWQELLLAHDTIELLGEVEGKKRFVAFFEAAATFAEEQDESDLASDVRSLLDRYVLTVSDASEPE